MMCRKTGLSRALHTDPHGVWLYERADGSTQAGSDRHNDKADCGMCVSV